MSHPYKKQKQFCNTRVRSMNKSSCLDYALKSNADIKSEKEKIENQ
jgi:hypothetical protein